MTQKLSEYLVDLSEAARRSLSRIASHDAEGRNMGTISAFTGDEKNDMKQHKRLGRDLAHLAKKHQYGFVPSKGVYQGGHEMSYLVFGKKGPDDGHLRQSLEKLGSKYNQSSILHKSHDSTEAHLHGTKDEWEFDGKKLKRGDKVSVGKMHFNRPLDAAQTQIKGKRAFDYG